MREGFKVLSLSYKKAPVEIREVLSIDDALAKEFLEEFVQVAEVSDLMVLSTCNRTEIYYSHSHNLSNELIGFLCAKKGLTNSSQYAQYFDSIDKSEDAAQYLFRVSLGLEAQVVGDLQIINQIKRAYQMAADANTAGPYLHRLLHTIFFANKRVVQETAFRDGAASVSYATAELIKTLAQGFVDAKILVIGLGEIGEDLAKNLMGSAFEITLTNRSTDKLNEVTLQCGFGKTEFEGIKNKLAEYDIVVSSLPIKDFIDLNDLEVLPENGLKYFIDLSIPRSISPAVESIKGVSLYNIDEINDKTSQAVQKRIDAIPQVEAIIAQSMTEFLDWSREMEVSPTIHKLKKALEDIRQEELKKHLKNASPEVEAFADKFSKSITNKIMKLPVLQLKAACQRGEAETLIDVLNDLFNLEKDPVKQ
ncbi:glutamyl-tRNA reductase [Roseivirga sp. UBA1976]|uniref:glutamyl-tRNA reductase n=1 Tax=Roseivirga sp. UBA1976 TaxID=1947386 RepID=UPI00258041B6|nr:glutamyl-tRNA reductase [Roseivirga sp. UBA1976]MEC7752599.1 glutamyl-tRNA reductase [Bacteroidota bacterium]|tara:strand:+ start:1874 stop:3136 length:1263 start_codon:yes stop_codon:yes gene_type:complete